MVTHAAPERAPSPTARRISAPPAGRTAQILQLQRTVGNRAVTRMLQRDGLDDIVGQGESIVQQVCAELNTATNPAVGCAHNPHCPSGFCAPLPNRAEAIAIRNLVRLPLLAGIRVKVNPRVVSFWDDFMGSGFSVGGDPSVRDLTPGFGGDFARSPTTADTTQFLTRALISDLEANRPAVAPGDTITVDIPTRIPAAVAAINDPNGPNQMNFNIPADIAGNLAGGIGADEASCRVGAHPSPQNDARIATGTARITGNADGSLTVEPDIHYEVRDTIDLCPGDCGTDLEQCATVILSRLEATGVSGDIAFRVEFPAPAQAPLRIAPVPPVPTPKVKAPASRGTVTADVLRHRRGPGTGFATVGTVPNGTELHFDCFSNGTDVGGDDRWCRRSDTHTWVSHAYISDIGTDELPKCT